MSATRTGASCARSLHHGGMTGSNEFSKRVSSMPHLPQTSPFGTSLARQVARQNLTRFNNVFWVAERARKHIRAGFSSIQFPPVTPGVHGVFNSALEWETASDEFRDWTRQHVLISAASLLEVYINAIAKTALHAKPELLDRSLTGVDGYSFLLGKASPPEGWKTSVELAVESFTKGLWKRRFRQMEVVFGKLPEKLVALEPELQKVQNKRNRIAHKFGSDKDRSVPWAEITHVVVGASDCDKAIRTVSAFIAEADTNVFEPLVGAHEVLGVYHEWSLKEKNFGRYRVMGTRASKFCDHIGSFNGAAVGKAYAQAVIDYHNSL